jgi:hypothetical protein
MGERLVCRGPEGGLGQRGWNIKRQLYDLDDDVFNFLIILGPSQEEIGGGGWYWTLFMAAILLAGILTLSTQLAKLLSNLKEINTT